MALTMQKAVVFEAAAAEEGVEGVQGLLPLHRLGARPVDVGSALRRQHVRVRHLRELPVPGDKHPGMCTLSPPPATALPAYITTWAHRALAQVPQGQTAVCNTQNTLCLWSLQALSFVAQPAHSAGLGNKDFNSC